MDRPVPHPTTLVKLVHRAGPEVIGQLERLGATYLLQRWVEDGKFITSAGVSAGIDMALALVARLTDETTARRVQLAIEYDPHPPFGGIDWDQVDRDIYEPVLGPMVQQQLADRPELLAKLSS